MTHPDSRLFLPMWPDEVRARGWKELDVILVSGDAYVDHPSFGTALIGRLLESRGYRVGIIAQPDWRSPADFARLGKPRLFFGVTAGSMDSMVANFSRPGKRRRRDDFSPGGRPGLRPDRATIVYINRLREVFGSSAMIMAGGIEASLRRMAHYDFWDDAVRRSILLDSRADVVVYGMGERAVLDMARHIQNGEGLSGETRGTVVLASGPPDGAVILPSLEEVTVDKAGFNKAFILAEGENNPILGKPLAQRHGDRWVIIQPPAHPLNTGDLDELYALPFQRRWHPMYEASGGVPALEEVLFSITAHRGCLGSCGFCTLAAHQGRIIQSRSDESVVDEARSFVGDPRFKGVVHDVGGPSANFHDPACANQLERGPCRGKTCLHPEPCRRLNRSQAHFTSLLRKVSAVPGIRRVFVRSGVRFDMALLEEGREFLRELASSHVSGQLKVAPEHVDDRVLRFMGKPPFSVFTRFAEEFERYSAEAGKKQYLVPYFISGHPGADLASAVRMAQYVKKQGRFFEQVQDFIPLPMTRSACQWYTGVDPLTGEHLHVPKDPEERRMHRALLQFQDPANWSLAREALRRAGREDLIGSRAESLVPGEGTARVRGRKVGRIGRKTGVQRE